MPDEPLKQARALIDRTVVWDNHVCMPVARPNDTSFLPQLQRYRDAGVDAVTLNIGFGDHGVEDHFRTLASMRRWLLDRPEDYVVIQTAGDVVLSMETGRLAVAFDIEGANAIGDQISLLEAYRALGVRWMLLAYNRNNRVGGGCQDEDKGLTPFGRDVVREMERLDMLVCLSHTGHRTARDVLAMAQKPVIFFPQQPRYLEAPSTQHTGRVDPRVRGDRRCCRHQRDRCVLGGQRFTQRDLCAAHRSRGPAGRAKACIHRLGSRL